MSLRDCPTKCGDVAIPYPFGTKDGCYYGGDHHFYIHCDETTEKPLHSNSPLLNVSVAGCFLRVLTTVASDCYGSDKNESDPYTYTTNKHLAKDSNKAEGDGKVAKGELEQGKDWRKMDQELEHRATERPETDEEKALKAEIEDLKKELEKEPPSDPSEEPAADPESLLNLVQVKEKELEILTKELDDKARVSQKAVERPGFGAGRYGNFSDRPPSRTGSVDGSRNSDFADRPRSRGTGDVGIRPGEDRRGSFHGNNRERGFLGNNRNFERNATRERW